MMIEIWEVVNYEEVSKIPNLLYSQNLHSFSPLFHPNSASNHPKITLFSPHSTPFSPQNHPQFSLHFTVISWFRLTPFGAFPWYKLTLVRLITVICWLVFTLKITPFTQLRPAHGLGNSQSDTLSPIKNIIKILQNSITYVNFVAECEKGQFKLLKTEACIPLTDKVKNELLIRNIIASKRNNEKDQHLFPYPPLGMLSCWETAVYRFANGGG